MLKMTRAVPIAVSLAVVLALTAVLWYLKLATVGPHNPAFFYVLPITILAIIYGSRPALLGVLAAFLCADYFLYDPIYSLDITSRVELGDLACFSVLAIFAVKCACKLFQRTPEISPVKSPATRR